MKKIYFFALMLILCSCSDDEFSPTRDYESRLAVYCLMDSRKEFQIVKIQSNIPEIGMTNPRGLIQNISVKILDGRGESYILRDTNIIEITGFQAFYSPDLKFAPGSYTLMINSDNYPFTWGTVNVPDFQEVALTYHSNSLEFGFKLNNASKGFIYHVYMDYVILDAGKEEKGRIEVPSAFKIDEKTSKPLMQYPEVIQRKPKSTEIITRTLPYSYIDYIRSVISAKGENYRTSMCIIVYSLDWNLFDYLQAINGFLDPYSVRLDQPCYTNIIGGLGIFGAIRRDSIEITGF